MNINRNNCESFFLDYYEKNLSPVEIAEVLFFLEENPDLKSTFESYRAVYIGGLQETFSGKEALKKNYGSEKLDLILSSEITRHNCQEFFVAKAENILSQGQADTLESFLTANRDLKKDFDLILKCSLSAAFIPFDQKDLLKKNLVNAENREEYFIRCIDNDLIGSEKKGLSDFLQKNPSYNKEFELFSKTLLPAENIPFKYKQALKKKEGKPRVISIWSQYTTYYYAAAATILFLAGLFFFFRSHNNSTTYFTGITHIPATKTAFPVPSKEKELLVMSHADDKGAGAEEGGVQTISVNKKSAITHTQSKERPAPMIIQAIADLKDPLTAKIAAENKPEDAQMPTLTAAINTEQEKDSLISGLIAKSDPEPPTILQSEESTVNNIAMAENRNEYKTFAAVINKKLRSMLGVEASKGCETKNSDDKINIWALAMLAKQEIQNAVGTKVVDVSKVCDGTGNKAEYVFTAGNFQISKSAPR